MPPDAAPPFIALAFAIIGAVVRGARLWALISVGIAWLIAIVASGLIGSRRGIRSGSPSPRSALALLLRHRRGHPRRASTAATERARAARGATRTASEQEERTRIARELHDVLAHSLSQIAVQSGVGLHLFDSEPERAREALANIRTLSATGLDEVRGVLSFLRGDETDDRAPLR